MRLYGHTLAFLVPTLALYAINFAIAIPSYWSIDVDDSDSGKARHPSLMVLHSVFMVLAFLGALAASSSWYAIL